MATSFAKIKSQIEKLQKQAAEIQTKVISRIKSEIAQHGLTAEDLFGTPAVGAAKKSRAAQLTRSAKTKAARAKKPAKFADGQGNFWHGIGKRPQWIRDMLAAGRQLEEFLVGNRAKAAAGSKATANASKKSPAKKAVSKKAAPSRAATPKKAAASADTTKAQTPGKRRKAPAGAKPTRKVASKKAPAKRASRPIATPATTAEAAATKA